MWCLLCMKEINHDFFSYLLKKGDVSTNLHKFFLSSFVDVKRLLAISDSYTIVQK